MEGKNLLILAGACIVAGVLCEVYLMRRYEEINGKSRPINYANVLVIFTVLFGMSFAFAMFRDGDEKRALQHIKVGEPPF